MYCMKLRNYIAGQFKKRRPIELHFDVLIGSKIKSYFILSYVIYLYKRES